MRKNAVPLLLAAALAALAACASNSSGEEISREQAIEIARQHVTFEPRSIEAEKATDEGRPVWRVTFRGEPLGPTHPMGELQIIFVDRKTGEVVSLAMT
jgi:hypothetical protein